MSIGKYKIMHVVPGTNLFIVIFKNYYYFFWPQQCGILVLGPGTEHMPSTESEAGDCRGSLRKTWL